MSIPKEDKTRVDEKLSSVVILSTGRTGTKFLSQFLQKLIPDASVFHEAGERSRLINIFGNAYLSGFVPHSFPIWAWQRAVSPALQSAIDNQVRYIDSNNHIYVPAVKWPELYAELKIIHIVRDPRTYARSHLNWSKQRLKSFLANYLTPFWQPNAFLLGKMSLHNWIRMNKLEKFAWIWNYKNRFISKIESSETPYLLIKFEDLFYSDEQDRILHQLLDFIGCDNPSGSLEMFNNRINTSRGRSQTDWLNWSHKLCTRVDRICGDLMRSYGYGLEEEWTQRVTGTDEKIPD